MAVNFNKVFVAGNLTRDPQVRFFANERAVADIGIACNRKWRDRDGNQQEEKIGERIGNVHQSS